MKILRSSLLLLAVSGMTMVGCGEPATEAPTTPAPAAETPAADGSGEKAAAPAEGAADADADSDKKEG